MKRVIAVVMVVMMTALAVNVWGGSLDLSMYDDAALVEMLGQVQQEVVNRHIEKTAELQSGAYIGGRDIPVGTYVWTCMASGDNWGNVTVYALGDSGEYDEQKFWQIVGAPDEGEEAASYLITVNEGEKLESGVPFSLTIYAGAAFR